MSVTLKVLQKHLESKDEQVCNALYDSVLCCFCKTATVGTNVVIGVRVVLCKIATTTKFFYNAGFGSTSICMECAKKRNLGIHLDSNTPMHEEMYTTLEDIAHAVGYDNMECDLSGEEFLRLIFVGFNKMHLKFLCRLGKMEIGCAYCHIVDPMNRCSGCEYYRYCNEKCQYADWSKHKGECTVLKKHSIFYMDKAEIQK
jgi:hypothetical protein